MNYFCVMSKLIDSAALNRDKMSSPVCRLIDPEDVYKCIHHLVSVHYGTAGQH